jgi:hypothetical protein
MGWDERTRGGGGRDGSGKGGAQAWEGDGGVEGGLWDLWDVWDHWDLWDSGTVLRHAGVPEGVGRAKAGRGRS